MNIVLVGPGRAGHALYDRAIAFGHAARLVRDPADAAGADVVLLTVPDRAIAEVAEALPATQWVGHVSGATPLAALGPSPRRFVLHPAMSMERDGGAAQLDGVSAFTTGADEEAAGFAAGLAEALGLRAVPLDEAVRPLPHVACVFASNYLVTLLATACRILDVDDAPRILAPLARRALDNAIAQGAEMRPTGPVARGDASTIAAHLTALGRLEPAVTDLYVALARATLPIVDAAAARRVEALL
jgi:predicted short-subunit dehydrogenase-like oxidoreductase (DUF2520 family)